MPFYALGVNLALQIGQQANIKTLLDEDEIDIVLEAFCDNVRGTVASEPRDILVKYGQDLNKILSERSGKLVDRIKADGKTGRATTRLKLTPLCTHNRFSLCSFR